MNEKTCTYQDATESPIDVLFDSYFDSRGCNNNRVDAAYKRFCHTLLDVDPFQIEEIMGAASELCVEHERTGFWGGIRLGVRFMNAVGE